MNESTNLWKLEVSLYLDGASFEHSTNPLDQAWCTKSMFCRKRCESHDKSWFRWNNGKFFRSSIPSNGVVLCEVLKTRLTGYHFTKFIRKSFSEAFSNSANARGLRQS